MPESYTSYISNIEEDNYKACFYAAILDGYQMSDAETCEDGELKCSKCPWKKEEK